MSKLAIAAAVAGLGIASVVGCDPQKADWGFESVDAMQTPHDPPLACDLALPADTLAAKRQSCAFGPGALPEQTLGVSPQLAAEIPNARNWRT